LCEKEKVEHFSRESCSNKNTRLTPKKLVDKQGMVVHACNPSTQRLRQKDRKFKVSLGHLLWGRDGGRSMNVHQSIFVQFKVHMCKL
jgi:hypothetical protein